MVTVEKFLSFHSISSFYLRPEWDDTTDPSIILSVLLAEVKYSKESNE